jgi:GT2 family glycosyltransferase
MKLSIIIPTWNTTKVTLKCVKTIKKYLKNYPYEIVVIDNGSIDDTVKSLGKTDVRLIKNKQNLGFAVANNQGAKVAKGSYFLFLNSDMELVDSSLIGMVDYLQSNPHIGCIGPKFLNPNLTPQASVFPPQTIANAFKEFWLGQNTYSKYLPSSNSPLPVEYISGGALLISKSLFNQIGGWNQKYFFYYEDLDLCRAVRCAGKQVYYYPNCRVIHHHGFSGQNLADSQHQWRRLIPSSIKFHGHFKHYFINFIIWSGQKWQKLQKSI